ncbi:MAG: DNA translocase FtsK 4TM domain-containing protein [Phycisphaerales bacterium]
MAKSAHHKEGEGNAPAWRLAAALGLVAAWAFLAASLVSFDRADPPTHVVWPANDPVSNWCGPVGAWVAYHAIKLLGWGAWIIVLCLAAGVGAALGGVRVRAAAVRLVGVLMLASAMGAVQALLLPTSGAMADLAGGLVGRFAAEELSARFGTLGALVWLALVAGVGAVVAFDKWVLAGPAWLMGYGWPAAQKAGATVGSTAFGAARVGGALVAGLAPLVRGREPVRVRLNDVDDDPEIERTRKNSARVRVVEEENAAGAEPRGAERLKKSRVRVVPEPAMDEPEEFATEPEPQPTAIADAASPENDAPGAPQVFDPDALREKIARLPIAFGHQTRKIATEDDLRDLQAVADLPGYRFPGLDLLEDPEANFSEKLEQYVRDQATALESALKQYRIDGEVVGIESGPVITLYEVRLAPGTKVAQVTAVDSDIARALKAVNIRIVPNMQGRDTVGIEVPNSTKEKVRLKELMGKSELFGSMKLPMFLGKDASGEPLIVDLAQMPHTLIAGTTGSGKSVCINTIIMGFLYTRKPSELKLVLVDPKMVELSQFKDIPHLMCPVVTENAKAAAILEWATTKMDERYELLAEAGCRDIAAYNLLDWEELKSRFNPQSPEEEARIPRKLPYMVFIIDELADLMMTVKEVEGAIIRIAQKARAVGIHLILATQRPQANVVTGLIKSNMPSRVCFKVASGMDSRIVLDQKGGELLLGQGDMLYLSPRTSKLVRAQGTLVDDQEIRRVVRFMREVARPSFERQLMQLRALTPDDERLVESENNSSASLSAAQEDPLFNRAVEVVLETERGSVSLLQRRLAIGYTRASRLIDLMGIAGILGEHKGSLARDVQITIEEWEAMKKQAALDAEAMEKVRAPLFAGGQNGAGTNGHVDAVGEGGDAPSVSLGEASDPAVVQRSLGADDEAPFDVEPTSGAGSGEVPSRG